MEIRVDGSRSTSENWLRASTAPDLEIPKLTSEEEVVARKLGVPVPDYARSKYAIELTDFELRDKAVKLGNLVLAWLGARRIAASIASVWLKTFEGKYRIELLIEGKQNLIVVDESLVDEMLEEGSLQAKTRLENILEMNLLPAQAMQV